MTVTYRITKKATVNGRDVEQAVDVTAGAAISLVAEPIAAGQTDVALAIAFAVANVKWCFIHSTKALTLESNSGSAPANTLTLAADDPYEWHVGDPAAFKFTTDVTALYATLGGAEDAELTIEIGYDATP